eukprot:1189417-Prorocentrum_minimum.AAC.1
MDMEALMPIEAMIGNLGWPTRMPALTGVCVCVCVCALPQKSMIPTIAPIVRPDEFKPVKLPLQWDKPADVTKGKRPSLGSVPTSKAM